MKAKRQLTSHPLALFPASLLMDRRRRRHLARHVAADGYVLVSAHDNPKQTLLYRRRVDKTIELDGEHIQPLPDGRQIVTWEEQNPKMAEIYTIRWEW